MKIITTTFIISVITFCSSFTSFAQLTPGSYVIGGGVSFFLSNVPAGSPATIRGGFSLSPSVGKFVSEKYLVEGGVSYNHRFSKVTTSNPDSEGRSTINNTAIRFGATRFIPIYEKLYFNVGGFVSPRYVLSKQISNISGVENESTSSSVEGVVNINVGLTYFFNPKWMLFVNAGALSYTASYDLDQDLMAQTVNANFSSNSFLLGARYVLGTGSK